jgi:serine O-acetyltransferase
MFERIREDFAAHERDPWRQGVWVMLVYRFGNWRYGVRPAWLRKPLSFVYRVLKISTQMATGIDLPCEARVGRRLVIEHFGGIVVSGDSVIGDDVTLRHGVTLGLRRKGIAGAPVIGHGVDIGAGAKILGPVRVGDGAVIGANAVVLCDVPPGAIAVGIPARIKWPRAGGPASRGAVDPLEAVAHAVHRDELPAT